MSPEQAARDLDRRAGLATEAVAREVQRAALLVASEAAEITTRAGRDDRGEFRRGIRTGVATRGAVVEGEVAFTAPHSRYVLEGRRPGKMPPIKVIRGWAARKGPGAEYAYPIARAIAKRGTKGTDFLSRPLRDARESLPGRVQAAVTAALQ